MGFSQTSTSPGAGPGGPHQHVTITVRSNQRNCDERPSLNSPGCVQDSGPLTADSPSEGPLLDRSLLKGEDEETRVRIEANTRGTAVSGHSWLPYATQLNTARCARRADQNCFCGLFFQASDLQRPPPRWQTGSSH